MGEQYYKSSANTVLMCGLHYTDSDNGPLLALKYDIEALLSKQDA
jgi:hypothetical protein